MELAPAIAARAATPTGARDPDSLFGALIYLEAGGDERRLAKLMGIRSLGEVIDRARGGEVGRVDAFKGDEYRQEVLDYPDGLFAIAWQRQVIALLLRPDGATTADLDMALVAHGAWNAAMAVSRLRIELKPFAIKVESTRFPGRNDFNYRIAGTSAWRMQKIISNGWSV